jgi:hypothetical protein
MPKRYSKKHGVTTIIGILITAGLAYLGAHTLPQTSGPAPLAGANSQGAYTPPASAKTAGCVSRNDLPDESCTPGATIPTATKAQICVSGYSSTVRNVPVAEKNAVYAEYGITSHAAGQYEVDHLISLELGGSNDITNLWPEAASPVPGFHQKDAFENKLHSDVCNGTISLAQAQKEIATNWLQYSTAR